MKRSILGLALAGFLFTALFAGAASVEERAADLKKAINDEIASKPDAANANGRGGGYDPRMVAAAIEQITSQLDNPNTGGNVDSQINQMLAGFTSDTVQKARQDLLEAIHLQQKEKADAAASRMKDFLKHVSEEINKAKKPEDLDGLLVEMAQFQANRSNYGYGAENQALSQQVSGAFEFAKQWQNYLSHVTTGQGALARTDLQNLSQNNSGIGIMPRSHILELMSPANSPSESGTAQNAKPPPASNDTVTMLKSIKTLDDMKPTKEKIEELQRTNPGYYAGKDIILKQLIDIYEGAKMGLPVDIGLNVKYFTSNDVTPELQRQLVLFVFQKYFATYNGAPPGADENPSVYVNRVVADAVNRQDWTLLKQALNVREFLDENSSERQYNNQQSLDGVNALLAGINQDEARQYMLAVKSYQTALTDLPENTIMPKFIGDKLAAIQKDHPHEYEQGMQLVLNPPQPPMYGRQGYPAGMVPPPKIVNPAGASTNAAPQAPAVPVPTPAPSPTGIPTH